MNRQRVMMGNSEVDAERQLILEIQDKGGEDIKLLYRADANDWQASAYVNDNEVQGWGTSRLDALSNLKTAVVVGGKAFS